MSKPVWITFTGVDAYTDLSRLEELSQKYDGLVEWGVLFSEKQRNRGNLRYPPELLVHELRNAPIKLAAHLCGSIADDINTGKEVTIDLNGFDRVQVNHTNPNIGILAEFADDNYFDVIAQTRNTNAFPEAEQVSWLYDPSGGRGERPETIPVAGPNTWCGYAGGINPDNVLDVVSSIEASYYWIDMESGVRNEHDLFDLNKCEAVLEAVYGKPDNKGPQTNTGEKS